jgi:S-adenosyl methyltransferase
MTGSSLGPRVPPGVDTSVAHIARIQNYLRGGTDNFPADRAAAEQSIAAYPDLVASVRSNQAFLARAVRYLAGPAGVRQFLDIGTGLPTAGGVHEIASQVAPGCRVVYVDNDPVVLAHARALLAGTPPGQASYLDADLRDPARLVAQAELDVTAPVAILLVSVLHMIEDRDDPHALVAALLGAVPAGSFLALTHVGADLEPEAMAEMTRQVNRRVTRRATLRDYSAVLRFFDGLELVPPGVVRVPEWRPASPADAAAPSTQWGGVARKTPDGPPRRPGEWLNAPGR